MPRQAVPIEPEDIAQGLAVEYVDLDEVLHWPMNPKEHDLGAIAASINRFGFRDPIAVNSRNHEVEEGHGRLDTLLALKQQGREAPQFIRVEPDGRWLVPVMYFDDDARTQHGYALAHNRTQELGGGYDDARLLEVLREQERLDALLGTGFDSDDIEALQRRLSDAGPTTFNESYQILITCANEAQQTALLERFEGEGIQCRPLIS